MLKSRASGFRGRVNGVDLDVAVGFAGAWAELEAVADFAFDFLDRFVAGEGFDFDVADVGTVVLGEPAAGEAGEGAGKGHGRRDEG